MRFLRGRSLRYRVIRGSLLALAPATLIVCLFRSPAPAQVAPPLPPTNRVSKPEPPPVTPTDLKGTFQGPLTRVDNSMTWAVLEIDDVDPRNDTFKFTLSVTKEEPLTGRGEFSADSRSIRFATFVGTIDRRDDGLVVLRSDRLPKWYLRASASRSMDD